MGHVRGEGLHLRAARGLLGRCRVLLVVLLSRAAPAQAVILYQGWSSPVPGCSTGSYDTLGVTGVGGSYPYYQSDSFPCRAWKLAATICTTQPTVYNGGSSYVVNGITGANNWMCPVSGSLPLLPGPL